MNKLISFGAGLAVGLLVGIACSQKMKKLNEVEYHHESEDDTIEHVEVYMEEPELPTIEEMEELCDPIDPTAPDSDYTLDDDVIERENTEAYMRRHEKLSNAAMKEIVEHISGETKLKKETVEKMIEHFSNGYPMTERVWEGIPMYGLFGLPTKDAQTFEVDMILDTFYEEYYKNKMLYWVERWPELTQELTR